MMGLVAALALGGCFATPHLPPCESIADCPPGWTTCAYGRCFPGAGAASCDTSADCPEDQACFQGTCAVPPSDLRPAWTVDLAASVAGLAAVGDGTLYVPLSDGRIEALALDDGTSSFPFEALPTPALCLTWTGQGLAAQTPTHGAFYLPGKATAATIWEQPGATSCQLVVGDNGVFMTLSGPAFKLHGAHGDITWEGSLPQTPATPPVSSGNTAFIGLTSGIVIALPLTPDGIPSSAGTNVGHIDHLITTSAGWAATAPMGTSGYGVSTSDSSGTGLHTAGPPVGMVELSDGTLVVVDATGHVAASGPSAVTASAPGASHELGWPASYDDGRVVTPAADGKLLELSGGTVRWRDVPDAPSSSTPPQLLVTSAQPAATLLVYASGRVVCLHLGGPAPADRWSQRRATAAGCSRHP